MARDLLGLVAVVHELDTGGAGIADGGERLADAMEVDLPLSGNEVLMHAASDVLDMHMPKEWRKFPDDGWSVLVNDLGMANVEIEPEPGRTTKPAIQLQEIQAAADNSSGSGSMAMRMPRAVACARHSIMPSAKRCGKVDSAPIEVKAPRAITGR